MGNSDRVAPPTTAERLALAVLLGRREYVDPKWIWYPAAQAPVVGYEGVVSGLGAKTYPVSYNEPS